MGDLPQLSIRLCFYYLIFLVCSICCNGFQQIAFHNLAKHRIKSSKTLKVQQAPIKKAIRMSYFPDSNLLNSFSSLAALPSEIAAFYNYQLETNEYVTDVCTSVGIYSISNIIGQLTSSKGKEVDSGLVSRFALVGALDGSFGYYWFPTLEGFFPGTTLVTTVEKMIADTAIYGTGFTVCFLFLVTSLEKGFTAQGVIEGWNRVKQDFTKILFGGQFFWVPANGINYGLVPVEYRVLGGCTALLIYTLGLSIWELKADSNGQENLAE